MKEPDTSRIVARFHAARGAFRLDADLDLPGKGASAIFGPSGCGKTTILRAIAGLDRLAGSFLEVAGEVWQDESRGLFLPAHRRAIGYVFQEGNLFPHLTVQGNLEYGMRRRGAGAEAREHAMRLLGIGHLLGRTPRHLSGGERQRVALARALLAAPRLVLLDEPLASLDAARKREILPYLESLRDESGIPIVLVSHAVDEVVRFADHLVLLDRGSVVGSGPLGAMLARLDLPDILSNDIGVVVEGVAGDFDDAYRLLRLEVPGGSLRVTHPAVPRGRRMRVQIQSRDVSLCFEQPTGTSIVNLLPARVVSIKHEADAPGGHALVLLDAAGTPLVARITRFSCDRLGLAPDMAVWAQIKAVAVLT
ncbi:MAG TPA: molybdenum ABC transporter ATP-binding protein [Opitutaceae bacterium]